MIAEPTPVEPDAWSAALSTWSTTREKVLEHRFIAEVTAAIWRAGRFDFSVSHSEADNSGYDVIIEVGEVIRHIQLKAMQSGGTRRDSRRSAVWRPTPASSTAWPATGTAGAAWHAQAPAWCGVPRRMSFSSARRPVCMN